MALFLKDHQQNFIEMFDNRLKDFSHPRVKLPQGTQHFTKHTWTNRRNVALDILLTKFVVSHVRENVYVTLQKILSFKNHSKRNQYNDPKMQYFELHLSKGLALCGYKAMIIDSEKNLPPELAEMLPEGCKEGTKKKNYLAQFLSGSYVSKQVINACDQYYQKAAPNRTPLYMRK